MNSIIENDLIDKITRKYHRSPMQINKIQESDSEIIRLPNNNTCLAITTDSIVEEISTGLYEDPYLIGWMTVIVNLSDLSAVGAYPLGILISEILTDNLSNEFLEELHQGIQDACQKHGTFVLGGDTNYGLNLHLTGCALGTTDNLSPTFRTGCKNGDLLFTSGFLGSGNAFALTKLLNLDSIQYKYFPVARLKEGQLLSGIATSCMDTSDGVISTLDQLMRLNNVGFHLDPNWESAIEQKSMQVAERHGIPSWLLLAGQHGEFELIFTIEEKHENNFLKLASQINWCPIKLGKVIKKNELIMPIYNRDIYIDTIKIRNLASLTKNNISDYINSLLEIDKKMRKQI